MSFVLFAEKLARLTLHAEQEQESANGETTEEKGVAVKNRNKPVRNF
jgi:hypothetical protein